MRTWSRKNSLSGVKIRSEMDGREASVLRSLVTSVLGLLEDRSASAPTDDLAELTGLRTGNPTAPADATLARLLPDFFGAGRDAVDPDSRDANDNGALRSLYEPDIIDAKVAAGSTILRTVPVEGGKIVLTPEQAEQWLYGLNDIRLALGTTIGIDADTPDELDPDDPRAPHLDVYHWLTWMQDSLVQVLLP
ncbi:oxidative stress transcriptional regulator AosR [Rhodococcus triatomae]